MKKIEITYIGWNKRIVKEILNSGIFELKNIVTTLKWEDPEDLQGKKIEMILVESKTDLLVINDKIKQNCIMYEFNLKIPKEIIDGRVILNFHPGDLKTNRGPSPISWAILDCLEENVFSVHEIAEKFDVGKVVAQSTVKIAESDSTLDVKFKMENTLSDLLYKCYLYFKREVSQITVIHDGIYKKRPTENDYTIYNTDSLKKIQRKINSQKAYRGAIYIQDGIKYYIQDVIENSGIYIISKEGEKIKLR